MKKFLLFLLVICFCNMVPLSAVIVPPGRNLSPSTIAQLDKQYGVDYDLAEGGRLRKYLLPILEEPPAVKFSAEMTRKSIFSDKPERKFKIYYNSSDTIQPLIRMDAIDEPKDKLTFIKNSSGQYTVINGFAAQIDEILLLSSYDTIYSPISTGELLYAKFTSKDLIYNKRKCIELTVKICPYDNKSIPRIVSYQSKSVDDPNSPYNNYFPILKKFIIDKETNIIYSNELFSPNGQLILSVKLDNLDLSGNIDSKLFDSPKELYGKFTVLLDFERFARNGGKTGPSDIPKSSASNSKFFSNLVDWMFRNGGILGAVLGALSIVAIAGIVIFRRRRRA